MYGEDTGVYTNFFNEHTFCAIRECFKCIREGTRPMLVKINPFYPQFEPIDAYIEKLYFQASATERHFVVKLSL